MQLRSLASDKLAARINQNWLTTATLLHCETCSILLYQLGVCVLFVVPSSGHLEFAGLIWDKSATLRLHRAINFLKYTNTGRANITLRFSRKIENVDGSLRYLSKQVVSMSLQWMIANSIVPKIIMLHFLINLFSIPCRSLAPLILNSLFLSI